MLCVEQVVFVVPVERSCSAFPPRDHLRDTFFCNGSDAARFSVLPPLASPRNTRVRIIIFGCHVTHAGGARPSPSVQGGGARGVPRRFGRAKGVQATGLHQVPARTALPRVGTRKGISAYDHLSLYVELLSSGFQIRQFFTTKFFHRTCAASAFSFFFLAVEKDK